MSQAVEKRTPQQELVAQVRSAEFTQQVALALPEDVTPQRFVRVAITALQASPTLAELERTSVMRSLLDSAAMGLLPDGREAAIVPFKGKATLIPMIAGFRKIAADYGWTIYTAIAYANDVFEYEQGLDVRFRHVPVRPGAPRGEPIAAYAVGKHQDGRRELEVLTVEEVEKIRAVSQTAQKADGPWTQWWEQMAEKSAGKRLFKKLPLSQDDKRVRIVRAALEPAEAAAAIYGPQARAALAPGEQVDRSTGEITSAEAPTDAGGRPAASGDPQVAEDGDPHQDEPSSAAPETPEAEEITTLSTELIALVSEMGGTAADLRMVAEKTAAGDVAWLREQVKLSQEAAAAMRAAEPEPPEGQQSIFERMASEAQARKSSRSRSRQRS